MTLPAPFEPVLWAPTIFHFSASEARGEIDRTEHHTECRSRGNALAPKVSKAGCSPALAPLLVPGGALYNLLRGAGRAPYCREQPLSAPLYIPGVASKGKCLWLAKGICLLKSARPGCSGWAGGCANLVVPKLPKMVRRTKAIGQKRPPKGACKGWSEKYPGQLLLLAARSSGLKKACGLGALICQTLAPVTISTA